jgi:hypothetical protein
MTSRIPLWPAGILIAGLITIAIVTAVYSPEKVGSVIVITVFALAAASAMILLASHLIGPLLSRPANSRPGDCGDPRDDLDWAAPWETRDG